MAELKPDKLTIDTRFDSFEDTKPLFGKKRGNLPAMGWNSWNAFGSGNTEALTKMTADRMVELGLDKLGYSFVVLDDGCYKQERVDGKLSNEEVKFPSGFKKLADYIHKKGLKFGMYNDIGTNLCAGAAVGTCGHEADDAKSYIEWEVDFLKVDNCYYPFDNATFSDPENARFVFAPNIKGIKVGDKKYGLKDLKAKGRAAHLQSKGYVNGIGTIDGTGPKYSPTMQASNELICKVNAKSDTETTISVEYVTGKRENVGEWLQIAVGEDLIFDGWVPATESEESFVWSRPLKIKLKKGENVIRLMNHRRQENTLNSYARLLKQLKEIAPDKDIVYSACEWGKTSPHNWGHKVCDSWRILNDITFRVGSDGDPGHGDWVSGYTNSVTSQYNKAVVMGEYAGLDKGWNDPDMLMVGMEGLNLAQNKTHFAMWCMMNSPLMLGLDLRRVKKGDELYNIIANEELISINQDPLGVQARRIFTSTGASNPVRRYVRDNDRVDILVKPLEGGKFAVSFINLSDKSKSEGYEADMAYAAKKVNGIKEAKVYEILDVWTKKTKEAKALKVAKLAPFENVTWIVTPLK
ncbi:MAG: glycoside hydrolase family 27 protein [Lachnospiraceae bacterium]|nr:glycoside hydrolase family 27 protein [Lachnospiraceae bacterium]